MKSILLALDVENFSEAFISFAVDTARCFNAKVWIIHVAPYPGTFLGYEDGPEYVRLSVAEELREEHRFLQKLADRFLEEKIEAEALLIGGEIVKSVIQQADKLKADMIMIGVNRHGFIANALGGNTALEVIKRSAAPVACFPCS